MPIHQGYKPVWILAHESQEEMAKAVVKCCEDWQKRAALTLKASDCKQIGESSGDIGSTREIQYKDVLQWGKFADGFPNLFIRDVKDMAGKDATILSEIPSTARGPVQIMIFDIHALQERFYFSRSVIPRLESAIPLLQRELELTFSDKEVAVAFPDDGAEKRFSKIFPVQYHRVVCNKQRDGDRRVVRIKEGDPAGKNVVIVDDLVQTGGTLLEAAKVVKEAGACSVSAYATHAVFPKESWRRFVHTEQEGILANFWITDSIPHAVSISRHKPFRLLSLAPMIADCLLGFDLRMAE